MPVPPSFRSERARRWRRFSTPLIAVGLLVLLVAILVGSASERPSAAPRSFSTGGGGGGGASTSLANVTLTDAPSFAPSAITAVAGSTVTVHLKNVGNYSHTFTVSAQGNHVLNRSWTPTELNAYFTANGSLTDVPVSPGASVWTNFSVPSNASGESFEFVSLVPYQFQAGMFGFLNVSGGSPAGAVKLVDQTAGAGLAFVPAILQANASGYPLTIEIAVSNLGSTGHTWTVVGQPDVNLTPGSWPSYFRAHPSPANVTVPTTPGAVVWANFTVSKPGTYQFLCEVPGHFGAGMVGYLYVGIPAPPPPVPLSDAIVAPLLLVGAGSLLGVGVVLAAAASLVGRVPPPAPKSHH